MSSSLNTFLELTIENERLNERVAALKIEQQALDNAVLLMPRPSSSHAGLSSGSYQSYSNYGYSNVKDESAPQSPASPMVSSSKDSAAVDTSADTKEEDEGDGSKRKKVSHCLYTKFNHRLRLFLDEESSSWSSAICLCHLRADGFSRVA